MCMAYGDITVPEWELEHEKVGHHVTEVTADVSGSAHLGKRRPWPTNNEVERTLRPNKSLCVSTHLSHVTHRFNWLLSFHSGWEKNVCLLIETTRNIVLLTNVIQKRIRKTSNYLFIYA